ncbi:MAG: ATP-binding protein [Prevotellaceae bacterium]|nr:ATP-binding protein [Candidatus Minthosoma equi]
MNPFKFGTIVENDFFTDRVRELEEVKQKLNSENHLVLISPRRFGKSSLIQKALVQMGRPALTIDMMNVLSVEGFAAMLLKGVFKLYPLEKIRHLMTHFRVVPTISTTPMGDSVEVTFNASMNDTVVLEDAMALLEKVSTPDKRLIVVLDEFQEVTEISKGFDRQLRAIMQRQKGFNYVFLGSQESMMTEIFEKKKSPFYHFGQRMTLAKIPYEDFRDFLSERMPVEAGQEKDSIVSEILEFTDVHPYYTQQLASVVYDMIRYHSVCQHVVDEAVASIVRSHDLDFERLWASMNRTDRYVMLDLARENKRDTSRHVPTSTVYSSLQRLAKKGYVIKSDTYEIEDPFFRKWILEENA